MIDMVKLAEQTLNGYWQGKIEDAQRLKQAEFDCRKKQVENLVAAGVELPEGSDYIRSGVWGGK